MTKLPTIKSIKNSRPSREMVFLRVEIENRLREVRTLKEYKKLESIELMRRLKSFLIQYH